MRLQKEALPMDGFDTKQKLLLGGALLLCATMWWSLGADEPMVVQSPPPATPKAVGAKSVVGAELAGKKLPVQNPFSTLHENRVATNPDAKAPAAPKAGAVTAPTPAVATPAPTQAPPVPPAAPELTGIASGATGRLALIRAGERSYCAGVGEAVGSWQVVAIDERSCTLSGSTGEQTLYLP